MTTSELKNPFFVKFSDDKGGNSLLLLLLVTAVTVAVCNLWIPENSPLHISTFTVTVLGKYLAFALLALSVDLIWGYAGILSLGHGAFFCPGRLRDGHVPDAPGWR